MTIRWTFGFCWLDLLFAGLLAALIVAFLLIRRHQKDVRHDLENQLLTHFSEPLE